MGPGGRPKLGPIMGPWRAQAWAHHGPMGAQAWAHHGPMGGPSLGPSWAHGGLSLGPSWAHGGPKLGPIMGPGGRPKLGPIMGPRCDPSPKWVPLGARRVAEGPQMGLHLGPQMETVGPHMDPIPALNEKSSTRRGTRTRTTWGPITGP
jgi:hypothetical protein